MVSLPSIPNETPQVRAPTPAVSAADIAQPYNELASSMEKAGDVLSKDVAVPLATDAGLQAVTRDADGSLKVAHIPFLVGDAAVANKRAVSFSALTLGEQEAKRHDLELSKQFPNDPNSYLKAAEAFREQHVKQFTDAAGPEVGAALGRAIDSSTTQNYRFLLLQQQRNIKENFDKDTKSAIKSLDEDIYSLIETGAKEDDPALKAKIDERMRITHERVTNPVLSASPGEARLDLKQFDAGIEASKTVRTVNDILKTKGVDAADKHLNDMMVDQSIPPNQRVLNLSAGQKTIKEFLQNQERQVTLANRAQKASDQNAEDLIIQDTAGPNPSITENDIKTSNMSPESKMRMLSWLKRDGMPEPMGPVSQANTVDLFRRMNLPDGDPDKITDLRPIRDAFAPADGGPSRIKREQEEWLEKRFIESRSPEGDRLTQVRAAFTKAIAPSIDKSNPLLGKIDQDGKLQTYAFERYVDQKVDEYRKAGKDPFDLFNPNKPDYLGLPGAVQPFKIPLEQSIRNMGRNLTGQPTPTPSVLPQPAASPSNSNFKQATADLNLTPQEQSLYQRHLTNLTGPGGVNNPDGSRSTLFQMSVEHDGKTYNVPTVWDGKILKPDEAIKRVEKEGWDKFPSYKSEGEAEARYGKMHDYMEKDTAAYFSQLRPAARRPRESPDAYLKRTGVK